MIFCCFLQRQVFGTLVIQSLIIDLFLFVFPWLDPGGIGLSTSCSRFSQTFPVISKKLAQTLFKKQSKVALCNENCSKVARENKNSFGLMLKYSNCITKVRFLSIFVQFSGVTSDVKHICSQLKQKNVMSQ